MCLIGKPKATLRQPGFASDFSVSQKPSPALFRDKGQAAGVITDVALPAYALPTTVGNELFKDTAGQKPMTLSTNNRYLGFVWLKGEIWDLG